MWLIREKGSKVRAHIWLGTDTACRMWSTGGLKQKRFGLTEDRGNHEVCTMCQHNMDKDAAARSGVTIEQLHRYRSVKGYDWRGF